MLLLVLALDHIAEPGDDVVEAIVRDVALRPEHRALLEPDHREVLDDLRPVAAEGRQIRLLIQRPRRFELGLAPLLAESPLSTTISLTS